MMTETDDQLVSGNGSIITVMVNNPNPERAQRIRLLMWQSDSTEPIKISGKEKRNHAFPYSKSLTDFVCCEHEGRLLRWRTKRFRRHYIYDQKSAVEKGREEPPSPISTCPTADSWTNM